MRLLKNHILLCGIQFISQHFICYICCMLTITILVKSNKIGSFQTTKSEKDFRKGAKPQNFKFDLSDFKLLNLHYCK